MFCTICAKLSWQLSNDLRLEISY